MKPKLTAPQLRTLKELAEAGEKGVIMFRRNGGSAIAAWYLVRRGWAEIVHYDDRMLIGWRITPMGLAILAAE